MALHACDECKKDVSDEAHVCPHCGKPQPAGVRHRRTIGALIVLAALIGGGVVLTMGATRKPDYSRVEQLRAEQDVEGTHDDHVRQRFYRHYKAHPDNAMYIYLWARCVDDATEQLRLSDEGIHADPKFAWSYNIGARALARLGRVQEAYERASQGAAIDPSNMQIASKVKALKSILDHKLLGESTPGATTYVKYEGKESLDKGARYQGLFRTLMRTPDRADLQAIETSRLSGVKARMVDEVRGLVLCSNPYADACLRVYVARDPSIASVWPAPAVDIATLHEHDLVSASGAVVTTSKGEKILLADTLVGGQ